MLYTQQLRERYGLIVRYVGTMIIGVGVALLLPLLILPMYPEELGESKYFLISAVLAILFGSLMRNISKRHKEVTLTIQEGGVIVLLSWLLTILFSAVPFWISGRLNFTQGIFEVVSGWTTTGLSVIDVTQTPKTFLLWRSIMQFFGGAGLAVVMLSAIIGPHGMGLYNAEGRTDQLMPNVAKSTKLIMQIYIGYVVGGTILYIIAGMPWFDAINHSIAALSTGGFSTEPASIGAYQSLGIELITIILMIVGTINFAAHVLLLKGNIKEFFRVGEIRFMFFLMSISIPVVAFFSLVPLYGSMGKGVRVSVFELVSAISTTGFSTVGYGDWNSLAIFIMIILMIIGGGAGSTAGGIKLYRVYIMLKSLIWNIKGYLLPKRVVREHRIDRPEGEYFINKDHVIDISNFITLYLIIYGVGVAILVGHGYSLQDSMFEFASSLSTVGLSVGITSPDAPVLVLWTQITGMMLGRLEFFVVFFAGIKMIRDVRYMAIQTK